MKQFGVRATQGRQVTAAPVKVLRITVFLGKFLYAILVTTYTRKAGKVVVNQLLKPFQRRRGTPLGSIIGAHGGTLLLIHSAGAATVNNGIAGGLSVIPVQVNVVTKQAVAHVVMYVLTPHKHAHKLRVLAKVGQNHHVYGAVVYAYKHVAGPGNKAATSLEYMGQVLQVGVAAG